MNALLNENLLFQSLSNVIGKLTKRVEVLYPVFSSSKRLVVTSFFLLTSIFSFGQVSVTATIGTPGPTSYTTLKLAFDAVNAGTHKGSITISIIGNTTETASASLNASGTGLSSYTALSISPSGGTSRTISGAIAAGSALINLNGADNITIDGLNSAGNSLSLTNTRVSPTAGTSTIRFIGDASNNIIQNCTIAGSETTATSGTIFFSTGTTTGNDSNSVTNCTITAAGSNLPTNAIYSAGTSVAVDNSGNSISNCSIQDYFNSTVSSAGILVNSNSASWTITNNKFFQTSTRTTAKNSIVIRAIRINTASGGNYSITNNTIGFANALGTGNTIYNGSFTTSFRGIEFNANATVSSIQGNTISGINFTTSNGVVSSPGIFSGIVVRSAAVNIGTTSANTIGSTTVANAIVVTSSSATSSRIDGIYVSTISTTSSIQNNNIGGISTSGGAANGYSIIAINTTGTLGNFTINNNTIGSSTIPNSIVSGTSGITTSGVCNFYGILNNATGTISITNNSILKCAVFGTSTSSYYGIHNTGGIGKTVTIDNNIIDDASISGGTNVMQGIYNGIAASNLSISNNTLRNLKVNSTGTTVTAILNAGAVSSSISINNNKLGDATSGLLNYSVASSAAFYGILNSKGTSAATLTIQGNDIRGITHLVSGSSDHHYIYNTSPTLSQNISSNTFTNLSVNTSGDIIFIYNNVSLPVSGTQTVSSNAIVGNYTKSGIGGTVTVFLSGAVSNASATITNNDNNFSNISVSGNTILSGWNQRDSGLTAKTINSNTFNNWSAGTGAVTGMELNGFGLTSSVNTNTVTNFTGQGAINGINVRSTGNASLFSITSNVITNLSSTGTGGNVEALGTSNSSVNVTIDNNTINTLSSTAVSATVNGIQVSGGTGIQNVTGNNINDITATGNTSPVVNGILNSSSTTINISKNKIYNLSSTSSNPAVTGIMSSGASSTVTIYNNLIGDLKATLANASNPISGINISRGTTANIYYNTILLNAISSGVVFGSSAIFVDTAVATTLRNNIFINNSVANGAGLSAAYRRSSTTLTSYTNVSNNNSFFGTTIYTDGTNNDTTLANFKIRMATRDGSSVSENTSFISIVGSSSSFLHVNTLIHNLLNGAAAAIPGITSDYDEDIRNVSTPDIGADEFIMGPVISGFTPTDLCISGGTVVTISGFNLNIGSVSVSFNGIPGTIISSSPTTIIVASPVGLTPGTISVTTSEGSTTSSSSYTLSPIAGTVSANQVICAGTSPTDISITGSTGTIQWQSSLDGISFTNILGATASLLTGISIGNLSVTTYFRAVISSGVCSSVTSATVIVSIFSTTWDGSVWSSGIPNSDTSAIFTGNYSSAGSLTACNLTVTNNATVIIQSGDTITLNGIVAVDNGSTLRLNNNAALLQNTNAANTGTINIKRDTNPLMRQDYTLWSSPVVGQQLLLFSPETLPNRFYTYSPTTDFYTVVASPATTNFDTATGYLIRLPNTHPVTPTIWTGSFTGVPNNGNITVNVNNNTYNAVGNPYPSKINADDFITANGLTEALYFWRKTNNETSSYATYTLAGGAGTGASLGDPLGLVPNGIIQIGQGFIAKSTSTSLNFTNSMRVSNASNQFFKTTNLDRSRIWLDLTNSSGLFSQTLIAYMTDATSGVDLGLDGKVFNDEQTSLTSLIDNQSFSVQARPLPFENTDSVSLSFKSAIAGSYTISINNVDGLFENQNQPIFLKDNLTNTINNLRTGSYIFTSESGIFNSRFEIIYQNELTLSQPSFSQKNVVIYKQDKEIVITTGNVKMSNVEIYDMSGRLLITKNDINSTEVRLNSGVSNQVLVVKITTIDGIQVTKKVIQ